MLLFKTLRQQEVPESYVYLLSASYEKQQGCVNGSSLFAIQRGVKQGDVLSSMLFNAGLESAFRVWRSKLCSHGFLLGGATRLSNVRYVDDIMLFAKTEEELIVIIELLIEAFKIVGLELNTAESKILKNAPIAYSYLDRFFFLFFFS